MTLSTFVFQDVHQLKVLKESSFEWFHAGQACEIVGIGASHANRTIESLVKQGLMLQSDYTQLQDGVGRPALYVSLEGLFALTLESKSPIGRAFKFWVIHDVLPAIFREKKYEFTTEDQQISSPQGLVMQLVAQAIELGKNTGLEPERIIELHKQLTGHSSPIAAQVPAQVPAQAKQRRPSKLASDEERLYQLRRVSAKFGGSASAREIAQFCKAAGSTIEAKRWLYDLVGKGLVAAEMVGRCQRFKVL